MPFDGLTREQYVQTAGPTAALRIAFPNAEAGGLAETIRRLDAFRP